MGTTTKSSQASRTSLIGRKGRAPLVATMTIGSTGYETFAWWLARQNIGQSLRQRYAVAKELPPSSSTPFSKLDVLKAISCYAHVGNASDAGEMPIITKRGLKGVRAPGAMRGFGNGAFDPQTLVLLETTRRSPRGTPIRCSLARGQLIVASLAYGRSSPTCCAYAAMGPRTEPDNAQNQRREYSDIQNCINHAFPPLDLDCGSSVAQKSISSIIR